MVGRDLDAVGGHKLIIMLAVSPHGRYAASGEFGVECQSAASALLDRSNVCHGRTWIRTGMGSGSLPWSRGEEECCA